MKHSELRAKYNPDGSTLRKAQLRMLEMLKFIDKICLDNNLTYWLDSGTLLGAARHHGFIPWDDDADICMPYEDATKFKQIMLHNNPSNEFVLQCNETDSNYLESWFVLRDLKSEYLQDSHIHQLRKYRGLQVDIFPLENTIRPFLFKFCSRYQAHLIDGLLLKNNIFAKTISKLSYHLLHKLFIPFFRIYKRHNSYYNMCYGCTFISKRFLSDIYPIKRMKFEGFNFNVPNNYNGYLNKIYKNWKSIPDKIETHNVVIIFKDL